MAERQCERTLAGQRMGSVPDLPSFDDVVLNFEDDGSGRGVVLCTDSL
jgi:hypothetical protein